MNTTMIIVVAVLVVIVAVMVTMNMSKKSINNLQSQLNILTAETEGLKASLKEKEETISSIKRERDIISEEKNKLQTQVEVRDNEIRNKNQTFENETSRLQNQIKQQKADAASELQKAKDEAFQELQRAKEEANRQVDKVKSEAAALLQKTKNEAAELLQTTKDDMMKASEKALADKQKACDDAMAAMETRHNEAIKNQETLFNETMSKVVEQAKNATGEMIKKSQQEFSESSSTNLGNIINPLMQNMKDMRDVMENNRIEQTKMGADMGRHIQSLIESAAAAKTSANELAEAFRHRPKSQGNWGERRLNELLDSQGFTKGVDYETQVTLKDKDGVTIISDRESAMMPDVILHLDKVRDVIIDSKVSLTAYVNYVNAETAEEKDSYLKDHVNSVWNHVVELSKKKYDSYVQAPRRTMDYVIMFVPQTSALHTAIDARPDMWRKAMEMGVYIADEQTLYAALRIINLTWTQIRQMDNQKQVFKYADEMLKRVGMFWEQYRTIGKALATASKAYNEGEKKIKEDGQSIATTAKNLLKLGAKEDKKYVLGKMLDVDDIPGIEYNDVSDEFVQMVNEAKDDVEITEENA